MKRSTLAIVLVSAFTLVGAIAFVAGSRHGSGSPAQAPVAGTHFPSTDQVQRTVYVYSGREPAASPPGPRLHAMRVKGPIPARATVATVLTDENCEPDADGVSHCINRIRLPNGKTLVVQHPHNMDVVPCLAPQERVTVRRG